MQFTMETSDTQHPFLDIMINKEGKTVFMDIYSKPTDSKRYVSFKSNHPRHCLKNIQFSLAHRICVIAEKDSLKEINLKELKTLLLEQHYCYKCRYKQSFKNTPNWIKKCKETRRKEVLTFYFNLWSTQPQSVAYY